MAEKAVEVAKENIEAFNKGDWEKFTKSLASDSVYEETATQRKVKGGDQVKAVSEAWKKAFPDAKGTVTNAFASGNKATLEITWEGTHKADLESPAGKIPATGKHITVPAVQVVTVEGDKIKETRHFFDLMTLLQQIGAVPTPAGAGSSR